MFAGTFAVEGEALGIVTATGRSTRLAQIAHLTTAGAASAEPAGHRVEPRRARHRARSRWPSGCLFLIIAWLVGIRLTDAFLFALGVTVALVPEGLLPTDQPVARHWRAADGRARRAGAAAGVGRDAGLDDVHLHRQDRNADAQRDVGHGGLDAARHVRPSRAPGYDPSGVVHAAPDLLPRLKELAWAAAAVT